MNINVQRKKLRLGLIYGIVAGVAFTGFAFGADAWLLARANAAFFWVKLIPGLIICTISAGVVGWLTIRIENHFIALLLWGLLAVLYSWLVVWLPFTGNAYVIKLLDPLLAQWFDFSPLKDLVQFRLISLVIIGLGACFCGLLEINLIQQALLSPYISASITPLVVAMLLFSVVGSATDHLINSSLREPVQVVNSLLQFASKNAGEDVPRDVARKMHMSAVNQLDSVIQKQRKLTLIGYDENLGMMDILVNFEGIMVKCATIYAQPTDCIILTSNP